MTKVYLFDILENQVDVDILFSYLINPFKTRVERYSLLEDKKRSTISYYLLQKYLEKDFNYDVSNILIKENKYHKPYIEGIYFNISHSQDYVALVISDKECGIDIEKINYEKDYSKIAKKVLKNDEYERYLTNKNPEIVVRNWSLMEAYNKYLGTGIKNTNLSFELNKKSFEQIVLNINEEKYYLVIFYECDIIDITKATI